MIVKFIVKCVVMRMGSGRGGDPLPMLDVEVPEYFISDLCIETAGGCIRVYGCMERRGVLIPRYSALILPTKAAIMARQTLQAVAEHHNKAQLYVPLNGGTEH